MATTHDLRAVAFPKLTPEEIEKVARCTRAPLERYRDGDVLIRAGVRESKFLLVVSGQLAVLDESGDEPKTIAILGPGEFTGEVTGLTGAASLVTIVARSECEVSAPPASSVREIISRSPVLGDRILQAFIARRQLLAEQETFAGPRVIGSRHSRDMLRIRQFLAKNQVPFATLDLEQEPAVKTLFERLGVTEAETPIVALGRDRVFRNPSNAELAAALGIRQPLERKVYDLVVVGAGPAGLAAAVYGASEGLDTLVLERTGPGGQAGSSMRIENYLGFPTGITGGELAERATVQAAKFGACIPVAVTVVRLSFDSRYAVLEDDAGETTSAKCLLIASGAEYRRLEAEGCERFEGCGVYYAATPVEAPVCRGSVAVVVGGGNSAGQAAVYLASIARKVYVVVRGDSLYKSMSSYLAKRIEQTENIEVLLKTRSRRMLGEESLRAVEVVNDETGEVRTIQTSALFSFIGAVPRTDWLPPEIEKDEKGFVKTGIAVAQSPRWSYGRSPFLLETTRAGVFAAGDVRSGSVKRVASAVGEGAMAVQVVHEYLRGM
ncbi:MAG: thioredoxin reductase [Myxococcales bacterium 68-20]|nr:MAG: thioredoxin reductase [Myxococcales bacterium 68-20]